MRKYLEKNSNLIKVLNIVNTGVFSSFMFFVCILNKDFCSYFF